MRRRNLHSARTITDDETDDDTRSTMAGQKKRAEEPRDDDGVMPSDGKAQTWQRSELAQIAITVERLQITGGADTAGVEDADPGYKFTSIEEDKLGLTEAKHTTDEHDVEMGDDDDIPNAEEQVSIHVAD